MEITYEDLRGRTKAAILLGFLSEETAKQIVAELDTLEKEIVLKEVTSMGSYESEIIEKVLMEFLTYVKGSNYRVMNGGSEYAMKLLEGAMPEKEVQEMMNRIYTNNIRPFDSLKRIRDVGPLITFLSNEDPQTIAVVASHMKPTQAAELLESFSPEKMSEVAMAIAKMEQTNKEVLIKIEKHLNKKLESFSTEDSTRTDGVKTLVGILNNVNRYTEKSLFEKLDEKNEELAKKIKQNMFVFEDIVRLDNLSLQKVLSKITDQVLIATALKSTTEEMKEKFYSCMTQKRKEIIEDAAESLGAVRKSEVEEAQQQIANIVKEMEKSNEIVIQRGEEDVIL